MTGEQLNAHFRHQALALIESGSDAHDVLFAMMATAVAGMGCLLGREQATGMLTAVQHQLPEVPLNDMRH